MLEWGRSFFIPASAWLFESFSHNFLNTVDAAVGATDYCLYACQRFLTRRRLMTAHNDNDKGGKQLGGTYEYTMDISIIMHRCHTHTPRFLRYYCYQVALVALVPIIRCFLYT